jgi:peroxiredoxin
MIPGMSASNIPAPGDLAPDFSLPESTGATVTLAELTADMPCVLVFYRGHW